MEQDSAVVGKVLIVGNVATGKTSLIRRYVHGFFSPEHRTTVGVDFALKTLGKDCIPGLPMDISLQLWDVAGQERFAGLSRIYYRDAVAAVVVFDLTDRNTFDGAMAWKEDIDSKVFLKNGDNIPVLLVGNKADLAGETVPQCCDDEAITAVAKSKGFVGWCKTSAKENLNIEASFEAVAKKIANNQLKLQKLGYSQYDSGEDILLLRDNNHFSSSNQPRVIVESPSGSERYYSSKSSSTAKCCY